MIVQIYKPLAYANSDVTRIVKNNSNLKFFVNGFGLALSSPTAILWFATIGGSMIATQRLERDHGIILFLSGFFTASLVWSIVLSYISFKGGQLMKNRIKKIFSIISALIFLILAIYVFLDGYKTLIK
jgi:L-lysine exporter family protein LysE/ArgO